ncbi:Josephin-2 [Dirofilaria immitis]|nr:Josephin-2 [Dirofilaria immitis]
MTFFGVDIRNKIVRTVVCCLVCGVVQIQYSTINCIYSFKLGTRQYLDVPDEAKAVFINSISTASNIKLAFACMNVDESSASAISAGQLYHEKQQMQLCLMHTLNTLLQRSEFKKVDLDCIAENLHSSRWFNRHRSMFGLDFRFHIQYHIAWFNTVLDRTSLVYCKANRCCRIFNFDSKLNEPMPINDFVAFSDSLLAKGAQLMVVVEPQNAKSYLLNSKCLV